MKNGVATKFDLLPSYCPDTNVRFSTVRDRELLFALDELSVSRTLSLATLWHIFKGDAKVTDANGKLINRSGLLHRDTNRVCPQEGLKSEQPVDFPFRRKDMRRVLVAIVVTLMCAVWPVAGQSTFGSIVGAVHDASQGSIAGASLQIRSLEDNSIHSTTADADGSFEFVNLKSGKYALSTQAAGFAEFQVPSAELNARQTLRIDVTMTVETQVQRVEVSDTVAVINTENGIIGDSKGTHVRRVAIRADRRKWRKPYWPGGIAARLLTLINGNKGTATAICGGPLSIANISFEEQLSNAQRRQLGVGPITDHEK